MPFTKGHNLWKHPNAVKTQFKKGVKNREYKVIPCEHENKKSKCLECRRKTFRVWYRKNNEKCRRENREYYKKIKKNRPEIIERMRVYARNWAHTTKGKYKVYRRNALDRNLKFEITIQEYEEIVKNPCSYCGNLEKNGIDRVNNEIGYIKENCVASCHRCNFMKLDKTVEEFTNHCKKVVDFFIR